MGEKRRSSEKGRGNSIVLFFLMHSFPSREVGIDIYFFSSKKQIFFFTLAGERIGLWTLSAVKLCLELDFCSASGSRQVYIQRGKRSYMPGADDTAKSCPHLKGISVKWWSSKTSRFLPKLRL